MTIGERYAFNLIKASLYKDAFNMDNITAEQWEDIIEILNEKIFCDHYSVILYYFLQ